MKRPTLALTAAWKEALSDRLACRAGATGSSELGGRRAAPFSFHRLWLVRCSVRRCCLSARLRHSSMTTVLLVC